MTLYRIFTRPAKAFVAVGMLLASCANQLPPPGGPIDTTPPTVKTFSPQPGTVRHPVRKSISFTLSEWIDPAKAKAAIIVSPAPPGGITVSVTGRTVEVAPKTAFADSTTYHIALQQGFTDLHGVNTNTPFDFYFSTGEALDSARIRGRIAPTLPAIGTSAALWRIRTTAPSDSLLLTPPDYLAPADSAGRFLLDHVRPGNYRAIAFTDANNSRSFNPGTEQPWLPIDQILSLQDSITGLLLFPADGDTAAPRVASASPLTPSVILCTWKIRPAYEEIPTFAITRVDSAAQPVMPSMLVTSDPTAFVLTLKNSLPNGQYRLTTTGMQRLSFRQPAVDSLLFNLTSPTDTLRPKIKTATPQRNIRPSAPVTITFTEPVSYSAKEIAAVSDSGDTIRLTASSSAADVICATPNSPFLPGLPFNLLLDTSRLADLSGNRPKSDSLSPGFIRAALTVIHPDSIAISFVGAPDISRPDDARIWRLATATGDTLLSKESNGGFRYDSLPPGPARISCFSDINGNGKLDRGRVFPFVAPEPSASFSDTLAPRARWEIEDIVVKAAAQWPEFFTGRK